MKEVFWQINNKDSEFRAPAFGDEEIVDDIFLCFSFNCPIKKEKQTNYDCEPYKYLSLFVKTYIQEYYKHPKPNNEFYKDLYILR